MASTPSDGRWPWPGKASPKRSHHPRCKKPMAYDLARCDSEPTPATFKELDEQDRLIVNPVGRPFYDLDKAGGSKMSFRSQQLFNDRRYASMRPYSGKRFGKPGGEALGLFVGTNANVGPSSYASHKSWLLPEDAAPSSAGLPAFRDGQLRIPENKTSWLLLRSRSSEIRGDALAADTRHWMRHANGRPKGAYMAPPTYK